MLFLILTSAIAFYVACNLGANDVANSMGTSVGSKAVTLRQALIIAGVLEFAGAVLFGHRVSATLATQIVEVRWFETDPQTLLLGMMSALIAGGIWLQIATTFKLPVASSHAIVGAIAGFGWVAIGLQAVKWQIIGWISLTWVLTPVMSGAIAVLFYSQLKRWILDQPDPMQQLKEWIPWLSTLLVVIFGAVVLPSLEQPAFLRSLPLPSHDIPLIVGAIATVSLTVFNWRSLRPHDAASQPLPDRFSTSPERLLARFQLLSACFVAFAHGSNDVGNAIAPLAAIAYIHQTGTVPLTSLNIPLWILLLGGVGIVTGLAIWGKRVIQTIGEGIVALQPSSGFCAEIATATTTLLASRLGLPVSTSHALVGAVVGIGLWQRWQNSSDHEPMRLGTVRQIALAWLITIPAATALSALLFRLIQGAVTI